MSLSSWADVDPGVPVHHHCHAMIEYAATPDRWTDPTTTAPDLVAWSPAAVVGWLRDQLAAHVDEAVATEAGEGVRLAAILDEFSPTPAPLSEWQSDHLPDLWERAANCTSRGRWLVETWKLGSGRRLVLWMLSHADAGCRQHARPAEEPYRAPAELASV